MKDFALLYVCACTAILTWLAVAVRFLDQFGSWVKPTRFGNMLFAPAMPEPLESGARRCTVSASTPSSAPKHYAIYYRNFWLLGNWTARHIVENIKVFRHASRTSRRMWVGRRNSEHKKTSTGLRIKEWLGRGERATISRY